MPLLEELGTSAKSLWQHFDAHLIKHEAVQKTIQNATKFYYEKEISDFFPRERPDWKQACSAVACLVSEAICRT